MEARNISTEFFKNKIFNYTKNKEWKFEGQLPTIIDFYTNWCGPCKMVAPILDELAIEYNGTIQIFKVDLDQELELSTSLRIRNTPCIMFIPLNKPPMIQSGAIPKYFLKNLLKKNYCS